MNRIDRASKRREKTERDLLHSSTSKQAAAAAASQMGFFSFLGRVLFASIFILSAWQMFDQIDVDGGPAAKELIPKISHVRKHISTNFGLAIPDLDVRHVVAVIITLKGLGGLLFVFGSSLGAYLLLLHLAFTAPLLYDFYNYSSKSSEYYALLDDFIQSVAFFGALLFFIGMKNSITRRQLRKKTIKSKTV